MHFLGGSSRKKDSRNLLTLLDQLARLVFLRATGLCHGLGVSLPPRRIELQFASEAARQVFGRLYSSSPASVAGQHFRRDECPTLR